MILLVFLDGVGLGPATAANPFVTLDLPAFERLAGGQRWTADATPIREPEHVFIPIDATLGLEGLPQSGTGQAALFTGENAAAVHGRSAAGPKSRPVPVTQRAPKMMTGNVAE